MSRTTTQEDGEYFNDSFDQEILFRPYSTRFHTGTFHIPEDEEFHYVDPEFNKFNRIFGRDCIVGGYDAVATKSNGENLSLIVDGGKLIADDVFIEIDNTTVVTYQNAHAMDESGYFILMTDFANYMTLNRNHFRFMFSYFDADFCPIDDFNPNRNRMILGIFKIMKYNGKIKDVIESSLTNVKLNMIHDYIVRPAADNPNISDYRVDGGIVS